MEANLHPTTKKTKPLTTSTPTRQPPSLTPTYNRHTCPKQFVEIQKKLNERGVLVMLVNERNVGKLYRQFLALVGGLNERVVQKNQALAQDIQTTHTWLRRIARCLRYPPGSSSTADQPEPAVSSQQIKQDMDKLLKEFQPDFKRCPAQAALHGAWHRVWKNYGPDLLHCYNIPGLPPDNLQLEALFGRFRNHQHRVSGRKSTRELRDFGHCQVLFLAASEDDLLEQLRQVPLEEYQDRRKRLAEAEAPRQLLRRLHRDPFRTIRHLVGQYAARRAQLTSNTGLSPP